jgi:DNA-binding PadR family transcriptional regulator
MVSKALIAASTKPMILSILLGGENYGYQIIQSVKHMTGGILEWSDGMLYPVLHRMEKDGLIRSQWKMSGEGRLRKYYTITGSGKKELVREREHWMSVNEALTKLWAPHPVF